MHSDNAPLSLHFYPFALGSGNDVNKNRQHANTPKNKKVACLVFFPQKNFCFFKKEHKIIKWNLENEFNEQN